MVVIESKIINQKKFNVSARIKDLLKQLSLFSKNVKNAFDYDRANFFMKM